MYPFLAGDERRITPAYAGIRVKLLLGVQVCGDHPRIRGDKFYE